MSIDTAASDGRAASVADLLIRLGMSLTQAAHAVDPVLTWFDGMSPDLADALLPVLAERIRAALCDEVDRLNDLALRRERERNEATVHLEARVAELEAENDRQRGPFSCCPHCVDDPGFHEDNPNGPHDLDCTLCEPGRVRAERDALRAAVDRVRAHDEPTVKPNLLSLPRQPHRAYSMGYRDALATVRGLLTSPTEIPDLPAALDGVGESSDSGKREARADDRPDASRAHFQPLRQLAKHSVHPAPDSVTPRCGEPAHGYYGDPTGETCRRPASHRRFDEYGRDVDPHNNRAADAAPPDSETGEAQ